MLYDVYNLGSGGDEVAALTAGAVRGEVRIVRRFPAAPYDKSRTASVCEPGTRKALLPPIAIVGDILMNSHSMVIEGTVIVSRRNTSKSATDPVTVRWLCKFPGAPAVLNTEKLRARRIALREGMATNPLHPAYDDVADEQSTYGPPDDSIV